MVTKYYIVFVNVSEMLSVKLECKEGQTQLTAGLFTDREREASATRLAPLSDNVSLAHKSVIFNIPSR